METRVRERKGKRITDTYRDTRQKKRQAGEREERVGLATGAGCTEGGEGGSHANIWGEPTPCRRKGSKVQVSSVLLRLENSKDVRAAGAQSE